MGAKTNKNQRKRRQVLVDPDGAKGFIIDEEDYLIVREIRFGLEAGGNTSVREDR